MIVYLDTSAFVPLIVEEPGSPVAVDLWMSADEVVSSRLLYVEAAAALARAHRLDRLSLAEHRTARSQLDDLWQDFRVIDVDEVVVRRGAELAESHRLRGYDAVHCASAERIGDPELVVASGDHELLVACADLALATARTGG